MKKEVRTHLTENVTRLRNGNFWLPACASERDANLRSALVNEFGSLVASEHMSEECGWHIDSDYITEAAA